MGIIDELRIIQEEREKRRESRSKGERESRSRGRRSPRSVSPKVFEK